MFVCLCTQAQITRAIWGLTLGQSTAEDVRKTLREKGYGDIMTESTNVKGLYISVKSYPIRFGGGEWNSVSFNITNGRLEFVVFTYTSKSSVLSLAKKMYNSLYNKYSVYKLDKYPGETYKKVGSVKTGREWIWSDDYAVCFQDGRTKITLTHSINITNYYRPNTKQFVRKEVDYSVSLIYSDKNLGGAGSESDL